MAVTQGIRENRENRFVSGDGARNAADGKIRLSLSADKECGVRIINSTGAEYLGTRTGVD